MINLTHETANSGVELFQITKITVAFEENYNLNYQFDKWLTICGLLWILVFIICVIVLILLLKI